MIKKICKENFDKKINLNPFRRYKFLENEKKTYILEACVDSVESAAAAERGGADRLELCANLVIGGTTPGISLFRQVRKHCSLPIFVLIRPRYGDFLYTEPEIEIMEEDIRLFKDNGADGIVTGCLCADGSLNREHMLRFRQAAPGIPMTLHRAFDLCRDPEKTLETAVNLGITSILTSGQEENCLKGKALLQSLVRQAENRIHILAGGGVCAETIVPLLKETGVKHFHMSGKILLDSPMLYRKEQIHMGIPGMSEYTILRTDEEQIRRAKALLCSPTLQRQ